MRAKTIVKAIVSITRYAKTAGGLSDAVEELDVGGRKIYGCRTSWNLGTAPARGLEPSAKSPPSRINFLDDPTHLQPFTPLFRSHTGRRKESSRSIFARHLQIRKFPKSSLRPRHPQILHPDYPNERAPRARSPYTRKKTEHLEAYVDVGPFTLHLYKLM